MTPRQKHALLSVYGCLAGVSERTDEEEALVERIYEVLLEEEPDLIVPLTRSRALPHAVVGVAEVAKKLLAEIEAIRYMVSLPDPHRPGEFYDDGPFDRAAGLAHLRQWYGPLMAQEVAKVLLVELAPEEAG